MATNIGRKTREQQKNNLFSISAFSGQVGQSLDTPTLHFRLNFKWAFTWIGPVNVPARWVHLHLRLSRIFKMNTS